MCEYEIEEYKMLMKWILEAREREIWGRPILALAQV